MAWPFAVIGVVLNVNKIVKKKIVEQKKNLPGARDEPASRAPTAAVVVVAAVSMC